MATRATMLKPCSGGTAWCSEGSVRARPVKAGLRPPHSGACKTEMRLEGRTRLLTVDLAVRGRKGQRFGLSAAT